MNPFVSPLFFNTQHSPIGAFASFTLGARGALGGLGVELGKPADQNVFIGLENPEGDAFSCLPFFEMVTDESTRFDIQAGGKTSATSLRAFEESAIARTLTPGCDCWTAGDLTFSIFTPVSPAPNPKNATAEEQKLAYAPALAVEIVVDNRQGSAPRRFFFGYQGNDPYRQMRPLDETVESGLAGIACGPTAIASDTPGVYAALAFTPEEALAEPLAFNQAWGLGGVGLLIGTVPAGVRQTFRFAICFYRGGIVTTGMDASYYYTRFFDNLGAVVAYSLANFPQLKARGEAFDRRFAQARLNEARRFMLAQAIHSYYGSTELLSVDGEPMWIVNEGEYRMMNTFDLTADQVFFEMTLNPWTVANELDWFVKRYSYTDAVRFPGGEKEHCGGLSFTHDMGIANHFSPAGRSSYEKAGLHGCFSHMTHEELTNWLMCALLYEQETRDGAWLERSLPVFHACLESLINRDHPDPGQRNGVMSLDSARCAGGSEITTYDSLDVSLGQSRHNLYLAVKCWGVQVGLAALFARLGDAERAGLCEHKARQCANTIAGAADENGLLPAILFENVGSRIIPAVEGLIIPFRLGLKEAFGESGPYGSLVAALRRHLSEVLKPGVCLFPDHGWKISSTSENSWLSKIYLCQFIAERVLCLDLGDALPLADAAHASWLLAARNHYWAWSDQIVNGEARGSKYYPRGVTAILWME